MIRKFAVLVAVVLVGLGVPVAIASAKVPGLGRCSNGFATVTVNVLRLRADVPCDLNVPVGSPATTIDLGGHTVRGSVIGSGNNGVVLTVKNGTVDGTIQAGSMVVRHVHVVGGIGEFKTTSDEEVTIDNSNVSTVFSVGGNITIRHSVLSQITLRDVIAGLSYDITDNIIVGNGQVSTVEPDGGINIVTTFPAPGTIARNIVVGAGGSGISVQADNSNGPPNFPFHPITIIKNLVVNNGGHGIDMTGTTVPITSRGNVAFANRTDPQCIGVTCKP